MRNFLNFYYSITPAVVRSASSLKKMCTLETCWKVKLKDFDKTYALISWLSEWFGLEKEPLTDPLNGDIQCIKKWL